LKTTVRWVCESRREFETQKRDERESSGEFSEGMMTTGKVNSFVYEKRLEPLLDSCNNMKK